MFSRCIRRVKTLLKTMAALALVCGVGMGIYVMNACKLRGIDGEREFFLDSASSQGLRKESLSLRDFSRIRGESVRFALNGEAGGNVLQNLLDEYGATVLFSEDVGGVVSYYCYTPKWGNCIDVGGQTVNFHVALSEETCAVGTPIIFGGF